jgi:hypothetical protein
VAPMDGFHLYKAELDAMPDPQVGLVDRGQVRERQMLRDCEFLCSSA